MKKNYISDELEGVGGENMSCRTHKQSICVINSASHYNKLSSYENQFIYICMYFFTEQ